MNTVLTHSDGLVSDYRKKDSNGNLVIESSFEGGKLVSSATSRYATYPLRFLFRSQDVLEVSRELDSKKSSNCIWVYVITFGGGFVCGDQVCFQVCVKENATCVLSTQASTKVYKSRIKDDTTSAVQEISLDIQENSFVCCLPDPVQCFRDARYKQVQNINMAHSANLIFVDWVTAGRLNRERWDFISFQSATTVRRDKKVVCFENVFLESRYGLSLRKQMGAINCVASVIAIGPDILELMKKEDTCRKFQDFEGVMATIGKINDGTGFVIRLAATTTEAIQLCLKENLAFLASRIGTIPYEH
mmetsp:Transcript_1788/g.2542  ORF Transcript_1788/g.2542 Transcript_1788/m.2542 type:complete len:303 (-) Transcript_1788:4436-5344(-)